MARSRNTADTQTASGGPVSPDIAGKNKIINGDFGVWQRGTSFPASGNGGFTADRFQVLYSGSTGTTASQYVMTSQELLTFRFGLSFAGTMTDAVNGYILCRQSIEDVRTLSNQTVTVSFYAKGTASGTIGIRLTQDFGSGGSPSSPVQVTPQTQVITTSWVRYSLTYTVPSISGKTLGTSNDNKLFLNFDKNLGSATSVGYGTNPNYTGTLSITGIQVEAGSTATPFQTATGTIQGELAACQRYYEVVNPSGTAYSGIAIVTYSGAALGRSHPIYFKVPKRTTSPTITITGSYEIIGVGSVTVGTSGEGAITANYGILDATTSGRTVGYSGYLRNSNDTTATIVASAEL